MTELQQLLYSNYGVPPEITAAIEKYRKDSFKVSIDNGYAPIRFACLLRLKVLGLINTPAPPGVANWIRPAIERSANIILGEINEKIREGAYIANIRKLYPSYHELMFK